MGYVVRVADLPQAEEPAQTAGARQLKTEALGDPFRDRPGKGAKANERLVEEDGVRDMTADGRVLLIAVARLLEHQ